MKSIAVFCASGEGKQKSFLEVARNVGSFLSSQDIHVIYGGAKIGLMGAVADGALSSNGRVTGVIPHFLKTKEVVHENLSKLIVVQTMHERKTKMSELSEGFIVLPGGFGTMEEFFEILTWAQLGLHKKPIGILNTHGYYDDLLSLFNRMESEDLISEKHRNLICIDDSIESLFNQMKTYRAPEMKNWMEDAKNT